MSNIFRYPLQPPVVGSTASDGGTDMVDYVMFKRKRLTYKDGETNYYGLNLPDNDVKTESNPVTVYIAMPKVVQTAYQPVYRSVNLGVAGMAMAGAVGADGKIEGLTATLQEAARAALPEFQAGALAQIASGASQALGLAGQVDSNTLMNLSQGKVFNPYTEQLFSNMQFRQHTFNFKFFARSQPEAIQIHNIIRYMKEGAMPKYGDGEKGSTNRRRFFEVPDKYDIKFVRMDPTGRMTASTDYLHFKVHTSVCTGVTINYTPDGQYNSFKDVLTGEDQAKIGIHVPAVTMNLQFTETKFVTQEEITQGY